jgi:hypothetical protein
LQQVQPQADVPCRYESLPAHVVTMLRSWTTAPPRSSAPASDPRVAHARLAMTLLDPACRPEALLQSPEALCAWARRVDEESLTPRA